MDLSCTRDVQLHRSGQNPVSSGIGVELTEMPAPKESVLHVAASMAMIAASIYLVLAAHDLRTREPPLKVLKPYRVGEQLTEIAALRALGKERLLLMWIQSTCRYCTESMDLYRRLALDPRLGARLVAMGPEPEDVIRAYLKAHEVDVDDVFTGPKGVRLYSTPTLLVLEPGLKVSSIWTGVLDVEQQQQLTAPLRGLISPPK